MQKIADNIYDETEFRGCNLGFVVTKEGVVMIDTPMMPADAIRWRNEVAKHGPVRYLINTEPHPDHYTGNHFFEGMVVAHEGTREAILATSVEQLKEKVNRQIPRTFPFWRDSAIARPPLLSLSGLPFT